MKIPDCDSCLLYSHNPHLVCTVHPEGVDTDKCLDFRPDHNAEIVEQWSPEGYSWYDGELRRSDSNGTENNAKRIIRII